MSIDVNVDILPKFHKEDGSSIVDGGQLPYRIQVGHHDVGKASQVQRKVLVLRHFPSLTPPIRD